MTRRSVPLRLLAGVVVLALLAGGIAVAWPGADWLKPRIEAAVRRATGRALKIQGPLRIGWGLAVDASDVSLANMPGGSQPEMARIGRIHAQLALLALLRGQFRISALSLIDPHILVERDAAGMVNWQLQRPAGPAPPAAASGGWTPRFGFRLDHLTTKGGGVAWRDAHHTVADGERPLPAIDADFTGLAQPVESLPAGILRWRSGPLPALAGAAASQWPLSLAWNASDFVAAVSGGLTPPWPPRQYDLTATLTAAASGTLRNPRLQLRLRQGQPVQADLTGLLDQEELHATGTLGADALDGGAAPLQAAVTWAGAKATAAGTLAARGSGVDAAVAAQVPDLARVAALVGRSSAIHGAIALDGHLVATRQRVAMTGMHLTIPGGGLAGDLAWTRDPRPLLTGNLVAKQLDLAALRALLASLQPPATTAAPPAAAVPSLKPTHIIPDQPLPFAGLRQVDADLQLQAARLAHPDLRDLSMHMLLRDGQLTLDPLSADAGGRLTGSVRVDARPATPTVAVVLHAPALSVASLLQTGGLAAAATGELAVNADLHGAGLTLHELAATLSGTATLASNGASFNEAVLAGLLGRLHLPAVSVGNGLASLRCLAAGFNVAAGQATVTPLVLDTSRLLVQGEGNVDLNAETLAMQMRPLLRTGPGIVIPLRLSGPWRAPKVSPEAGGLFGSHDPDPCAASLASLHAPPTTTLPATTPPPPAAKVKPPKPIDILRGLLR